MSAIIKKVLLLSAFCVAIETFRLLTTQSLTYIFLPANLLLAWIPLGFATLSNKATTRLQLLACLTGWLFFFPNAPYIITDLIHLRARPGMPMWFDAVLVYSFAFAGLIVGMLSAIMVFNKIKATMPVFAARLCMMGLMLISGYGIYLGRSLRFNSWEVITDPAGIMGQTLACICHPFHYPGAYAMTLVTGALLCVVFLMFESFIQPSEI